MPEAGNILEQLANLDPILREEIAIQLFQGLNKEQRQGSTLHYPSIVATPNVCGGAARLIRTRIPIWTLELMRRQGISEIDMLRSFPNIKAADLVQAWSYADQHREEMTEAIRENEEA
jgi:uncharacterized protein (DUF433 family)